MKALLFVLLIFASFTLTATAVALVSTMKPSQGLDFQINTMAASQPSIIQPNDPGSGGGGGGVVKK